MRAGIAIVSAVAMMAAQMPAGLAQNAAATARQTVSFESAQVSSISPFQLILDLGSATLAKPNEFTK
jgi:hypothetical protein